MLKKVISGGQTGVDRGGLDAALKLGIEIGGWCPRGRRAEDGKIPQKYRKLQEAPTANYPQRTEWNVRDSDATLIFCPDIKESTGTALTVRLCRKHEKPWFDVINELNMYPEEEDGYDELALRLKDFEVLNIAGPRESGFPGAQETAKFRFMEIFRRLVRP